VVPHSGPIFLYFKISFSVITVNDKHKPAYSKTQSLRKRLSFTFFRVFADVSSKPPT